MWMAFERIDDIVADFVVVVVDSLVVGRNCSLAPGWVVAYYSFDVAFDEDDSMVAAVMVHMMNAVMERIDAKEENVVVVDFGEQ